MQREKNSTFTVRKYYTLMVVLLLLALVPGCGSGSYGDDWGDDTWEDYDHPPYYQNGYSEWDFYDDPFIRVTPENVAAVFLEPYDAVFIEHDDTDITGVDIIPVEIEYGDTYTYEMDYDDDIIEKAILYDSNGMEVLQIDQWNNEEEAYLDPGEYTLEVHSYYSSLDYDVDHVVVFLFPESWDGYCDETHQYLIANAAPETDMSGIDLTGADLTNADLRDTNISYSWLDFSSLENADLSGSWIYDSSLTHIDGNHANLRYTDLRKSDLSNSDFTNSDFSNCWFNYALVKNTNLSYSFFTGADIENVNFNSANTTGVTW